MNQNNNVKARKKMIDKQIKARGIDNEQVIRAMLEVPRHKFISSRYQKYAYDDRPLPIEEGQTISQPYIVASMIQTLNPGTDDKILEIGTGSGYAAAVLSRIAQKVYTIERHKKLARKAEAIFKELNYDNIEVKTGDGTRGWQEKAPFDCILVSAAAPNIPDKLSEQLKKGGKMIIPVGKKHGLQKLIRVNKNTEDGIDIDNLEYVRFVPLVGEDGW